LQGVGQVHIVVVLRIFTSLHRRDRLRWANLSNSPLVSGQARSFGLHTFVSLHLQMLLQEVYPMDFDIVVVDTVV